jgi:hypothetical protein
MAPTDGGLTMPGPIIITVSPIGRGRFEARVGDRIILKSSRQPLLDAARVLLAEGIPPDTRITMRHAGANHDALSSTVGKAAGWMVLETPAVGPRFARWKPSAFGDGPSPNAIWQRRAIRLGSAGKTRPARPPPAPPPLSRGNAPSAPAARLGTPFRTAD